MSTIEEVTQKYNHLFRDLHDEFFETINLGTPRQERRLRLDKSAEDFNQRYAELNSSYKTELVVAGFVEKPPEPARDLAAEIDEIKARLGTLEQSRIP